MGNQSPVTMRGSRNFRQVGSKSNSSGSMQGCIGGRTSKCYFAPAKAELTCGTSVSYTRNYHNHSAEDSSFDSTCLAKAPDKSVSLSIIFRISNHMF